LSFFINPTLLPKAEKHEPRNTMMLFKAILASLVLLFLLVFTSIHSVAGDAAGKKSVPNSYRSWRRINHGSARGPRKHLVDPTVEHPFEVSKLPA
jgi:hypothetical protein